MPKTDLCNTWALVTGGGTRVGSAIVDELAEVGCNVIVHYCSNEMGARDAAERVRKAGRLAVVLHADLLDRSAVRRMVSTVHGVVSHGLDLLVHNAACFEQVLSPTLADEAWDRAIALNATAPYLLTVALSGALKQARGSVVAIACAGAIKPMSSYVPYATSKAALAHMVKGLALELAPDVRVNAVAPGLVMLPKGFCDKKKERLLQRIALKRIGEPGDVARAVRFLAENDYITGQMIVVDGGQVLG